MGYEDIVNKEFFNSDVVKQWLLNHGVDLKKVKNNFDLVFLVYQYFSDNIMLVEYECPKCGCELPEVDVCPFCGLCFSGVDGDDVEVSVEEVSNDVKNEIEIPEIKKHTPNSKPSKNEDPRWKKMGYNKPGRKKIKNIETPALFEDLIRYLEVPPEHLKVNRTYNSIMSPYGTIARFFLGAAMIRVLFPFEKKMYTDECASELVELRKPQNFFPTKFCFSNREQFEIIGKLFAQTAVMLQASGICKKKEGFFRAKIKKNKNKLVENKKRTTEQFGSHKKKVQTELPLEDENTPKCPARPEKPEEK